MSLTASVALIFPSSTIFRMRSFSSSMKCLLASLAPSSGANGRGGSGGAMGLGALGGRGALGALGGLGGRTALGRTVSRADGRGRAAA
jgi:hypothetical protein